VKDDILSDDEDIVISPSGVVSSKTVDEDTLTETQSGVSKGKGLATVSDFRKPDDRICLARWEMPRRIDTLGGFRMNGVVPKDRMSFNDPVKSNHANTCQISNRLAETLLSRRK